MQDRIPSSVDYTSSLTYILNMSSSSHTSVAFIVSDAFVIYPLLFETRIGTSKRSLILIAFDMKFVDANIGDVIVITSPSHILPTVWTIHVDVCGTDKVSSCYDNNI